MKKVLLLIIIAGLWFSALNSAHAQQYPPSNGPPGTQGLGVCWNGWANNASYCWHDSVAQGMGYPTCDALCASVGAAPNCMVTSSTLNCAGIAPPGGKTDEICYVQAFSGEGTSSNYTVAVCNSEGSAPTPTQPPPPTPTPTPICSTGGQACSGAPGSAQCCSGYVCSSNGTTCIVQPPNPTATPTVNTLRGTFVGTGTGYTAASVPGQSVTVVGYGTQTANTWTISNMPSGQQRTLTIADLPTYRERVRCTDAGGCGGLPTTWTYGNSFNFTPRGQRVYVGYDNSAVTIQGRFVGVNGTTQIELSGQGVSIDGFGEKNATPWDYTAIPTGSYTVNINQIPGYKTLYRCNGGSNCGSVSGTFTAGTSVNVSLSTNGNYIDLYVQYVLDTKCDSMTMGARAGQGGVPASGFAGGGVPINLYANIINDNGDHTGTQWSYSCAGGAPASITNTTWDSATFTPPSNWSTNCTVTYRMNNIVGQPACTGTFSVAPTYSISGQVRIDANRNGNVSTDPPYTASPLSVYLLNSGGSVLSLVQTSAGSFSFTGNPSGTYGLSLLPPAGWIITVSPNNFAVAPNATNRNFGIFNSANVCEDGIDNDGDGAVDCTRSGNIPGDSGCHSDGNPLNVASCCTGSSCTENPPGSTECSDNIDNNGNGLIDGGDPNCRDGDGIWDPNDPTEVGPPVCSANGTRIGTSAPGSTATTINPGASTTVRVDSCQNIPLPPGPSTYDWDPYIPTDPVACNTATISNVTRVNGTSTAVWNAPTCPDGANIICHPAVTVTGSGGEAVIQSPAAITVRGTYSVTGHIRQVASAGSACSPTEGSAHNGASLNLVAGSVNETKSNVQGVTNPAFACKISGAGARLSLGVPAGFDVVGTNMNSGAFTSGNGTNSVVFNLNNNKIITFCIAPSDPWYQTTTGDVRYSSLNNPVPSGNYASNDTTYPGIYYSSDGNALFGSGSVSQRGWVVNDEYGYNSIAENRNGTVAYSFYKSKARETGVQITELTTAPLNSQITGSGVYEYDATGGELVIDTSNPYTHVAGRRVVLLVNGDVQINTSISIPAPTSTANGVFIIAASGDINIGSAVGTTTLGSTATSLDGFYSAEEDIVIEGQNNCAIGPDRRLNIGGALIANARKPLASNGVGSIQIQRSLCTQSLANPTLYVATRSDFLMQLTDFYKNSYTKWREENP